MAGEQSRINGKKGGRKKGTPNAATLEKEKVYAEYQQKILGDVQRLYIAQRSLAEGLQIMYKVVTDSKGRQTNVKVEDPDEVERLLNSEDPDSYFFITVKEPNGMVIDQMMNRTFGKPKESVDVTVKKKIILDDDND